MRKRTGGDWREKLESKMRPESESAERRVIVKDGVPFPSTLPRSSPTDSRLLIGPHRQSLTMRAKSMNMTRSSSDCRTVLYATNIAAFLQSI